MIKDFNLAELELEANGRDARMKRTEEDGVRDILKYFDRIHDNLFNYNNLLIGGFFALAQLQKDIPTWTILIPIMNLWILVIIEYRMMEKSRFDASVTQQPFNTFNKYGKKIQNTNLISLFSIATTLVVTAAFLYYLIWI